MAILRCCVLITAYGIRPFAPETLATAAADNCDGSDAYMKDELILALIKRPPCEDTLGTTPAAMAGRADSICHAKSEWLATNGAQRTRVTKTPFCRTEVCAAQRVVLGTIANGWRDDASDDDGDDDDEDDDDEDEDDDDDSLTRAA